jgi:hypothetical protein
VITEREGVPLYVRDVAEVKETPSVRFGAVTKDGKDVAPSTIIPMPMARPESDIRLADMPTYCIRMKAMSMASGRVTTTTTADRISPRNRNRMMATRIEPSTSALSAVFSAFSTSSVADVARAGDQPQPAHQVLLLAQVYVLPTHLAIVGSECLHHSLEGDAILDQPLWLNQDLVLLLVATPGGYVVHSRRRAQQQAHVPVLQGAKIHGGKLLIGRLDGVPEHLPQSGAVRPEHRLAVAFGNPRFRFLQLLASEPAGKVDVNVILEIGAHIR